MSIYISMFKAGVILGFEHDLFFVGFPYGLLFSDRRSRYHALSQTRGCHQERRAGFRYRYTRLVLVIVLLRAACDDVLALLFFRLAAPTTEPEMKLFWLANPRSIPS